MSNADRDLTNLENVALAHIWRKGATTAHELRVAFAESSAGRYSGSAGAIYPLVKRLEAAGYVRARASSNGAQKKKLYNITKAGRNAVEKWIFDMPAADMFPDDPVRTRFQYLHLLARNDQARWFEAAKSAVTESNKAVEAEYTLDEYQSASDQHVLRSVLAMNRVRRRWLTEAETLPGF